MHTRLPPKNLPKFPTSFFPTNSSHSRKNLPNFLLSAQTLTFSRSTVFSAANLSASIGIQLGGRRDEITEQTTKIVLAGGYRSLLMTITEISVFWLASPSDPSLLRSEPPRPICSRRQRFFFLIAKKITHFLGSLAVENVSFGLERLDESCWSQIPRALVILKDRAVFIYGHSFSAVSG